MTRGENLANMLRSDSTAEMALDILENLEKWTVDLLPAIREIESAWRKISKHARLLRSDVQDPWDWARINKMRQRAYEEKILSKEEYEAQWDRPIRYNSCYQK